jgi:BRCA1 C Terminus (BRCT) domain
LTLEAARKLVLIRQPTSVDPHVVPIAFKLYPSRPGELNSCGLSLGSQLQFDGTNAILTLAISPPHLQVNSSIPAEIEEPVVQRAESNALFDSEAISEQLSNTELKLTPDFFDSASLGRVKETPRTSKPHPNMSSVPTEAVPNLPFLAYEDEIVVDHKDAPDQDSQATDSEEEGEGNGVDDVGDTDDEFNSKVTSVQSTDLRTSSKRNRSTTDDDNGANSSPISKRAKPDTTNPTDALDNNDIDPAIKQSTKTRRGRSPNRKSTFNSTLTKTAASSPASAAKEQPAGSKPEEAKRGGRRPKNPGTPGNPTSKTIPKSPSVIVTRQTPITPASSTSPSVKTESNADTQDITVALTSSSVTDKANLMKFLEKHGVHVATKVDETIDYLCVGNGSLKKTPKLLLAVALGKPVVSDKWVLDSVSKKGRLPLSDYFASDLGREKELGVDETWSSGEARTDLLKDVILYMTPKVKESYAEEFKTVQKIVKIMGAKKVTSSPARDVKAVENLVVLGLPKGDTDAITLDEMDITVYDKDMLHMAILRGKLELDSDEFKITPVAGAQKGAAKKKKKQKK